MARQPVFSIPTLLWHPSEGWRNFPPGETDPGPAWSETEGGHPVGGKTITQAIEDLTAANAQSDDLRQRLDTQAQAISFANQAKDEAVSKVEGLTQAAIQAQRERDEAVKIAEEATQSRDNANAQVSALARQVEDLRDQLEAANTQVSELTAQLEVATAPDAGKKK